MKSEYCYFKKDTNCYQLEIGVNWHKLDCKNETMKIMNYAPRFVIIFWGIIVKGVGRRPQIRRAEPLARKRLGKRRTCRAGEEEQNQEEGRCSPSHCSTCQVQPASHHCCCSEKSTGRQKSQVRFIMPNLSLNCQQF